MTNLGLLSQRLSLSSCALLQAVKPSGCQIRALLGFFEKCAQHFTGLLAQAILTSILSIAVRIQVGEFV
jgi:hypothetical protein